MTVTLPLQTQSITSQSFEISERRLDEVVVRVARSEEGEQAQAVSNMIADINIKRGKGIARRSPEELFDKITKGLAVFAEVDGKVIGFMYVAPWTDPKDGKEYVSNSALVVHPDYRGRKISRAIKAVADDLIAYKLPGHTPISVSMAPHVWKMNAELGYDVQEDFKGLPSAECPFWNGCKSCPNYQMLKANDFKSCVCKGMIRQLAKAMET